MIFRSLLLKENVLVWDHVILPLRVICYILGFCTDAFEIHDIFIVERTYIWLLERE